MMILSLRVRGVLATLFQHKMNDALRLMNVFQVNQELMVGTVVGRVVSRNQDNIWAPEATKDFTYTIKLDEDVEVPFARNGNIEDAGKDSGGAFPWDRPVVQHVSIAALTNNRPCHATQSGIKSEVWRQLTGAINKNGFPTDNTIADYEEDGGQITVGSVTKYIKRYSFFRVYARELGSDWQNITGPNPFAVRGTSPIAQYNTIHVDHPGNNKSAHEFKIVPVPGANFLINGTGLDVRVKPLDGSEFHNNKNKPYERNNYRTWFTGSTQPSHLVKLTTANGICTPLKLKIQALILKTRLPITK